MYFIACLFACIKFVIVLDVEVYYLCPSPYEKRCASTTNQKGLTLKNGDRVGQQLGMYRLVHLLGQNGFSEVYLGKHRINNMPVAIKVLDGYLRNQDKEKFLNQAYSLSYLEHPHIVKTLDFGIEGSSAFLVMSYVPNGTLRQRHPKGTRLSTGVVVSYVKQVVDALRYIHDQQLVHRDIKPHNMLVGPNNEILLGDFGIAVPSYSGASRSTLYDFEGTVLYAAPEQLQGKPRRSSDQYALGVVVYEWLCGFCPFSGSFDEVISQHLFASPPPFKEKSMQISPAVEAVVLTALSKEPDRRFARVQEFASALERASQVEQAESALPSFRFHAKPKSQFMSPFPFSMKAS
jgi:eukaryotic-like serine/threonine-protein kinase